MRKLIMFPNAPVHTQVLQCVISISFHMLQGTSALISKADIALHIAVFVTKDPKTTALPEHELVSSIELSIAKST